MSEGDWKKNHSVNLIYSCNVDIKPDVCEHAVCDVLDKKCVYVYIF